MDCVYGSELGQMTDEYGINLWFHKEREISSLVVKVIISEEGLCPNHLTDSY